MAWAIHDRAEHRPPVLEAGGRLSQGQAVVTVCGVIDISDQTYDRWRRKYGGLKLNQAKRLMEQENNRLKKALSELKLDKPILCWGTLPRGGCGAKRSGGPRQ